MGLHNGLIAIFAIRLLCLEVGRWHVNGETLGSIALYGSPISTSDKTQLCTKILSYKESQYVGYTETYKSRWPYENNPYHIKSRVNYKLEYHIVNKTVTTCCEDYVQIGLTCEPRCPQSCRKGTCMVPDVCTCNEGYRSTLNDTIRSNDEELCVPMCANGCVNGICIEPDICSCNKDYWMDSDGHTCRPVCDTECERNYGHCLEPNVCSCLPGYRSVGNSTTHKCEAVCDFMGCNGHCIAPNVCKTCADGYEIDELDEQFDCKPKCNETCEFGTCTAPGICTCDEGYRAVTASVCEPMCSKPCEMGTCVAPETCICNEGYGYGSSKYVCEPICEKSCGNGTCTAPGVCTCNKGFIYNQKDETCEPYCEIPCGNGTCISYNECKCFEGYKIVSEKDELLILYRFRMVNFDHSPHFCEPSCNACIHGMCIAPNTCKCKKDSKLIVRKDNVTLCAPKDADPSCLYSMGRPCLENGKCISHWKLYDTCICNDGYEMDTRTYSCVPSCAQACSNGTCTAPNHCVCHDDFIPNTRRHFKEECISACTRNCSGQDVCVDDDYRCECQLGWTGRNCDQPTMCSLTMDFDHSDINRITIRNDTNDTIMQVHENAPQCHHCNNYLNNESLCYVVQSDKGDTTSTVGCLLSTDLPCYNASTNVTKLSSFVIVATLFVTSLTTAAYLIYRRHQRKKLAIARASVNTYARESFATESLLSESVIYL